MKYEVRPFQQTKEGDLNRYGVWDNTVNDWIRRQSIPSGWTYRNDCQKHVDYLNKLDLVAKQAHYDQELQRRKAEAWDKLLSNLNSKDIAWHLDNITSYGIAAYIHGEQHDILNELGGRPQ
jgi:hypothetical protein